MYRNAKDERAICKIVVSELESRTVLQGSVVELADTLVLETSASCMRVRPSPLPPRFADVVKWQTHRSQKAARKRKGSTPFIGTKYGEMGERSKPRHC